MKKLFSCFGVAAFLACVWVVGAGAQNPHDPFFDQREDGQLVHVLPTRAAAHNPHFSQPTDAPVANGTAVYPASYGSGNLIDHGGSEMSNAQFRAIYWNGSVANSTATSLGYGTIKDQINGFVNVFSDGGNWDNSPTDDYTIVQQYGSHDPISALLPNAGFRVDAQPTKSKISDTGVRNYLASLFNAGVETPSASTLYGVYFPHGMRVALQGGGSCTSFCGYHSNFSYGGIPIKYAVFPYPDCSGCSLAGRSVADMLTIISSHEIRESVTDALANAWYDAVGYEADDKCAWHNLYQMTNGGFWVQPEYSNGGTRIASGFTATYPGPGCVVPNR